MAAGRAILITGCSSGIGLASALALKARGWRVLATARKEDDLARLRNAFGLEALHLELADEHSIAACAAAAADLTDGRLYAVFSNAAYAQPGAIEDLDGPAMRHQFEVNVIGTHDLTRRLVPMMRNNGEGRIVFCSSVLGFIAAPYRGAYCATKFAIEALADTMRLELAGSGVRVSLIEPGPIATRFIENALAAARANVDIEGSVHHARYEALIAGMERGGKKAFKLQPEAVARKLVHAVESRAPKRRYYVTTPTYLVAGLRRIMPTAVMDWLAARN
jgi:NAD(P)-dependent dehydrogenase (short-subunit alcohol dehydrogenase family)